MPAATDSARPTVRPPMTAPRQALASAAAICARDPPRARRMPISRRCSSTRYEKTPPTPMIGAQLVAVLVRDIESAPGSAKAYFVTDICFQHAAWEQNLVAALTWFTSPGGPSNDR